MSSVPTLIRGLFLLFFSAIPLGGFTQAPPERPQPNPLDNYVQQALHSNLLLQQKHLGLEKAVWALKAANSFFLPQLSFSAAYTHGDGGRSIALPVGDLLNPVYSTLNQLTESNNFPQIQNVEQNFFPQNFYDAHVRAAMPLVNTDLQHNKRLQQDKIVLQEWELKAYERELTKNVKQAYYHYLSAREAVKIWESGLLLVEQSLEVNESLLRNGKGLPATVLRAESELEAVRAQLYEAENGLQNAQRYFNFLLNKPQDAPIEVASDFTAELDQLPSLLLQASEPVGIREELQMIQTGQRLQERLVQMKTQAWIPKLNAFADLGAQADHMKFNSQAGYYLLGLSLDVPLFSGFRNRFETRQALLEVKSTQLQFDLASQQLQLAATTARNNLSTAYQHYGSAGQRLRAAEAYFRLLERGYKEGANSQIEFIDARNQLTSAQLQLSLSTYRVLSALAQYQREVPTTLSNP